MLNTKNPNIRLLVLKTLLNASICALLNGPLSITLYISVSSATFIYISKGVILIYFTVKEGIKPFETKIEVFN
jgi:hypothetical protein